MGLGCKSSYMARLGLYHLSCTSMVLICFTLKIVFIHGSSIQTRAGHEKLTNQCSSINLDRETQLLRKKNMIIRESHSIIYIFFSTERYQYEKYNQRHSFLSLLGDSTKGPGWSERMIPSHLACYSFLPHKPDNTGRTG